MIYEIDAIRKVMPSIHHVLCLSNSALILFGCINSVPFFWPKACASLQEDYQPPVTFVVVQKRHHTRLFPEVHKKNDKSGNILPGKCASHTRTHAQYTYMAHASLIASAFAIVFDCPHSLDDACRNRGRHQHMPSHRV